MVKTACRLMVGMVVASAVLGGAAGPARAQASCTDYLYDINVYLQCPIGPQLVVTPPTLVPGQPFHVDLAGWLPGSVVAVTVRCGDVVHAVGDVAIAANAGGAGDFVTPVGCTGACAAGAVVATGDNMIGQPFTAEGPITVGGSCAVSSTTTIPVAVLPVTGGESGRLVTTGAALVLIGGAALYGSLRVRRDPDA